MTPHQQQTKQIRDRLDRGAVKKFCIEEGITVSVLYAAFYAESIDKMTKAQRDAYSKFVAFAYTQEANKKREINKIETKLTNCNNGRCDNLSDQR